MRGIRNSSRLAALAANSQKVADDNQLDYTDDDEECRPADDEGDDGEEYRPGADKRRAGSRGGTAPLLVPTRYDEKWEKRFNELTAYQAKHGDCKVPQKQGELGTWVHRQRLLRKKGELNQDRVDKLNEIGFSWSVKAEAEESKWQKRFNELTAYQAKHGDCKVPQKQGELGTWVHRQRLLRKKGELNQDRVDKLNTIGFSWSVQADANESKWEKRYVELTEYQAKHVDCNVPQKQGELGMWVNKQREAHKKGELNQDRVDKLNEIGFSWSVKAEAEESKWQKRFNELTAYQAKHGDCRVPARQGELGWWVDRQRSKYKRNKLSLERTRQLVSIGFEFSLLGDATVRTDQLSDAEDSDDEFVGDYNDCNELPKMDTKEEAPTPSSNPSFDEDDFTFGWENGEGLPTEVPGMFGV